jgi:hypothetical protein
MSNTRPATPLPTWATDALYTSGPDNGQITKIAPLSGEQTQGYFRTGRVPARKLNWLLNKIGAWIDWIQQHVLDGENGGNYAPSAPIIVAGAGVQCDGPFKATASCHLDVCNIDTPGLVIGSGGTILGGGSPGLAVLAGGAAIDGNSSIVGNLHVTSDVTIDGTTLANHQLEVALAGIVVGASTVVLGNGLAGIIVQAGGINLSSGTGFIVNTGASFAIECPSEFDDEIVLAGTGRIRKRVVYGANANTTYSFSTADKIVVKSGALTGTPIYKIDDTGAQLGAEIEFINFDSHTVTVQNLSSGAVATVPALSGGLPGRARVMHVDYGLGEIWTQIE